MAPANATAAGNVCWRSTLSAAFLQTVFTTEPAVDHRRTFRLSESCHFQMSYFISRCFDLASSAISVCGLKILYGPRTFKGPLVGFGRGLILSIRNGGQLRYGKILARRNLAIFCDGGTVSLGNGVFFNNGCSLNSMASICVGDDTLFGENVKVYDHDHIVRPDGVVEKNRFHVAAVAIGKNCWIGSNATILRGVTLCDGVVIGAGAVVTKSINTPGIYVAKGLAKLHKVG